MSYAPSSIPGLPAGVDPQLRQFLSAIKENLEVRLRQRGNALDASPTFKDLLDTGLLKIKDGVTTIGGRQYTADQLLGLVQTTLPDWITSDTAPPAPTDLTVAAIGTAVTLNWSPSQFDQYGQTEVWRATSNNLSAAVRIGSTTGQTYVDSLPAPDSIYYYWIRDAAQNGLLSAFNDVNGTGTSAGPDAPVVSYVFSGPDVVFSWISPTSNLIVQYYIVEALVGASWEQIDIVGGNLYRRRADWLGQRQFRIKGVDVQGNIGVGGLVSATIAAPGAPTLSHSYDGDSAVLSWVEPAAGTLPIAAYRVYATAQNPSNLVAEQLSTVFRTKVTWASRSYLVTAVDTAGNEGVAASRLITASPPQQPVLSASFDGEFVRLSWSATAGSLPISYYDLRFGATYETGVPMATLSVSSFSIRADWTGIRKFWIAAVDAADNESTPASVDVNVSVPGTPGVSTKIVNNTVVLSWGTVASALPLAEYEVRRGAVWASAEFVAKVSATNFSLPINWTGSQTYLVAARDSLNNVGAAGAAVVSVNAPSSPTVAAEFVGPDLVLSWNVPSATLPIIEYEIRFGSTFAGATSLGRVAATTYTLRGNWSGNRTFWIAAIDQNGNVGDAGSSSVVVTNSPAPVLNVEVVDNNVLLRWNEVQGTLPTETYELRRGSTFASAAVIGAKSGAFTTVFETNAGQYTYWLAAIDIAGNYGTPASTTATVAQPPDYFLAATFVSTYSGTKVNAAIDVSGNLVIPVNTTQTWTSHFTSKGWSTPQDQINAGYPYFIQPGNTSGYYEEVFDYGTTLAAMKVSVDFLMKTIAGTISSSSVTITTALDSGFTSNVQSSVSSQMYAVNFRYVKVRISVTATDDKGVGEISNLKVKLDAKTKTQSGTITANAGDSGGTIVYITDDKTSTGNKLFVDVEAITLTPLGTTTPLIALYDFTDTPDPLSFKILLYNAAGVRQTGTVSYSVRGY